MNCVESAGASAGIVSRSRRVTASVACIFKCGPGLHDACKCAGTYQSMAGRSERKGRSSWHAWNLVFQFTACAIPLASSCPLDVVAKCAAPKLGEHKCWPFHLLPRLYNREGMMPTRHFMASTSSTSLQSLGCANTHTAETRHATHAGRSRLARAKICHENCGLAALGTPLFASVLSYAQLRGRSRSGGSTL